MGLHVHAISFDNETGLWRTALTLQCDGDHGMFPVIATFKHAGGYIDQRRAAMRAGWKDTFVKGRRIFLCPECSGK